MTIWESCTRMVLPRRSAMDWMESPFSRMYSTPIVFTASI